MKQNFLILFFTKFTKCKYPNFTDIIKGGIMVARKTDNTSKKQGKSPSGKPNKRLPIRVINLTSQYRELKKWQRKKKEKSELDLIGLSSSHNLFSLLFFNSILNNQLNKYKFILWLKCLILTKILRHRLLPSSFDSKILLYL